MSSSQKNHSAIVHLLAGGIGGSVGAVVTCPLEVIQTRLQSSAFRLQRSALLGVDISRTLSPTLVVNPRAVSRRKTINRYSGFFPYLRQMVKTEGYGALFKGLGPTLLGVTPSRAIYFAIYTKNKDFLNASGKFAAESPLVHMLAAAVASFANHTITNPLWFIKTRLQLDCRDGKHVSAFEIIRSTYKSEGIKTFYRGLTASYMGISETVIHFAIYEKLKSEITHFHFIIESSFSAFECMIAAGISKSIASSLCYPHEVARTRLRQQESELLGKPRYRHLFQTLKTILHEEGLRGLYGGLSTYLLRTVPNTAIMFLTYEGIVYFCESSEQTGTTGSSNTEVNIARA